MYQLGPKWKLWELSKFFKEEASSITLRGYSNEPPVSLPADFFPLKRRLSVEKIGSQYCPTRRDTYFVVKERYQPNPIWGQVAGRLIQDYCVGLLENFSRLSRTPQRLSYRKIHHLVEEYTKAFWEIDKNKRGLAALDQKAIIREESSRRLVFILQQSAKYELALLAADHSLSKKVFGLFVPKDVSIPITTNQNDLVINPSDHLGLSKITTPDFMLTTPELVMGEVKTSDELKEYHLTTVAGYALAYESQYGRNVNFGILYFLETHSSQLSFARSYVFLIDDVLRKQFLSIRNDIYNRLQKEVPPPLPSSVQYDTHCLKCKFYAKCYTDG